MPYISGRHVVAEALAARRSIRRILIAVDAEAALAVLLNRARDTGVAVQRLDRRALTRLADSERHQGVVAEVDEFITWDLEPVLADAIGRGGVLLALDQIQDPQNLGSLIRSAEAFGVEGLVLPRHRSASVTPLVERSSAGAIEHLRVVEVTNLTRALQHIKRDGVWTVGLDPAGSDRFEGIDLRGPLCVVVGAEGAGMSRLVLEECDYRVCLPTVGRVASLNAAVAGSIALWEIFRRRQKARSEDSAD